VRSAPRHRRPGVINVNIQMPETLRDEIVLLLLDTRTGRVPHGAWSKFIAQALAAQLARLKPVAAE
jgi:hypothetical protein